MHNCQNVDPCTGVPHVGGPIVGSGCGTVLIGGQPAAVAGDICICVGEPDTIIGGSTGVFIGGRPAAREGDACAHGGVVTGGWGSVLIGESVICEPILKVKKKEINVAINKCIILLERKLELLESRDRDTMEVFKKWFGVVNEYEVQTIVYRIQNALNVAKVLTIENFKVIVNEHTRIYSSAMVWSNDEFHTIYLGDF